jgi:hypothetical protein
MGVPKRVQHKIIGRFQLSSDLLVMVVERCDQIRLTCSAADDPGGLRIPVMSISRSELMSIRTERSDAGHSQCETVIDIRQRFSPFSAPGGGNALPPSAYVFGR